MDDKFALMPRAVAAVYMNATGAFGRCQARETNDAVCGAGAAGSSGGGPFAMKSKAAMMRSGGGLKTRRALRGDAGRQLSQAAKLSKLDKLSALARSGGGMARQKMPPYWATPQCVLKRHLITNLPEVRMGDCLRAEGQPAALRLVRPR